MQHGDILPMKTIFVCLSLFFLGTTGVLVYVEYKKSQFFNWNCFLAGMSGLLGVLYALARPLKAGSTYYMTNQGPVEVLAPNPMP